MANTASIVRWIPPFMDDIGDIRAGSPVLGPGQWKDMALASAWLVGRGGTLCSQGAMAQYLNGTDYYMSFYYAIHGREQIKARIWFLGLALASSASTLSATGHVTLPNSDVQYWTLEPAIDPLTGTPTDPPTGQTKNFRFVEIITSPTNTVETLLSVPFSVSRDATSTAEVIISGLYCRDVPMQDVYTYAGAAQYTPDGVNGYNSGTKINHITNSTVGVEAVADTQISSTSGSGVRNEARRGSLFAWSDARNPYTNATTSYTTIFRQDPPVLGRFLHSPAGTPETTRSVRVYVLAATNSGTLTATFKVTESTGATSATVTINSVTTAWYTLDISVDCDDMTRIDAYGGTRSGGRCTLKFEAKCGTAASVTIYAISVGEMRTS